MLILSRKAGERVKIDCPDGTVIWLTMLDGGIKCDQISISPIDDGKGIEIALISTNNYGNMIYSCEDGEVEIVYMPKRLKQHHDRVGIIAPKSFLVLREELLPDERS